MGLSPDVVYADILKKLFNADARQRLKVVNVKSSKGELALRVGDAEPFGLINIGDDAGFFKEAEKVENLSLFDTQADDFGSSMFGTLNSKDTVPLKLRPLAFDAPSEVQFVRDLEIFYKSALDQQIIGKRSLYLLRNADTKAKGLGFALAGNFYPDFLLWLVDDATGEQWLNFVDPKGLRQMSLNDPKLGLYKEVKVLQEKLGDPKLTLNAFIVSGTQFKSLLNVSDRQEDLEARNVLFMSD